MGLLVLLLFAASILGQAQSAMKLASYYNNHMVLQRGPQQAVLWGTADTEGDTVTARVMGQGHAVTATVQHGKWKLKLPAMTDPGPFVIDVRSSDGHVTLNDVLFGDVWLCSGQSNMQFAMRQVMNASMEIHKALNLTTIRYMSTRQVKSDTLLKDLAMGQQWTAPTAATLGRFSAVCFLFGEQLQSTLKYPIGLVGTYWGGTTIEAWSPPEALAKCPAVSHPGSSCCPHEPNVLWNSMMAPLTSMTVKGFAWYQGEANAPHPDEYACQTKATLTEWRNQFHRDSLGQTSQNFPFGYVQLGDVTNRSFVGSFPGLRWAQTFSHGYSPNQDLPNTFMAVALDLPDFQSPFGAIHPRYKQQVAERLARGALNVVYGRHNVQFQGPFPSSFQTDSASHTLTVQYDPHTVTSLEIRRTVGFDVCCSHHPTCDNSGTWLAVPIKSHRQSQVILDVSLCRSRGNAVGVRYAWRTSPCPLEQCAVYDVTTGLPAPPFIQESLLDGAIIG